MQTPSAPDTTQRGIARIADRILGTNKERDYFIENLSMLIAGGMPITTVLDSIGREVTSPRLQARIRAIQGDIESGFPLWKALAESNLFPEHAISLIKLGEESGRLIENLRVVALEQEKDRVFKSKLRSAMMYPIFVLLLTLVVGVGIAWFILPKLAVVFSQLKITLPLITKILIGTGTFLGDHGSLVVPIGVAVIALAFFFTFVYPRTKFIGQAVLLASPGIADLMREVEIARFGYVLGTLLDAGLPITQSLDSLASATEVVPYKKLCLHLRDSVDEGNSLQRSFSSFARVTRLIPLPIQQLIVAGEQSGTLPETLLKIGVTFEAKSDVTTKNLTIILEPILLVVVWLGVVAVALAVILPIYSLIGGFNGGAGNESVPSEVHV
jgi:type II secretory pathway component PulF